jgi:hypothetical protein
MKKKVGILFFLCFIALNLSAQEVDLRKRLVIERFESDQEVQWVKYFRGYLDNRFVCDILLASDGSQLHGAMRIELDTLVYYLDGVIQDSLVILEETDENGAELAFIGGIFDGISFSGTWKNKRGDLQFPFEFTETRHFKKLNSAKPVLYSFKTKKGALVGHWSVYSDQIDFISGTFISEDQEWFQIRRAGRDENGLWKIILVHEGGSFIQAVTLDMKAKNIIYEDGQSQIAARKWREYDVLSFQNKSSYSDFNWLLRVPDEYKRLQLFVKTNLINFSDQTPGDDILEGTYRGYNLHQDFFIPIYISSDWIIGQWVRSIYSFEHGHQYTDLLVHYHLGTRNVMPYDQWWSERGLIDLDLSEVSRDFIQQNRHAGVWAHVAESDDFDYQYERLVVSPLGMKLVNRYNQHTGLMLVPIQDPKLDDWVKSQNKKQ